MLLICGTSQQRRIRQADAVAVAVAVEVAVAIAVAVIIAEAVTIAEAKTEPQFGSCLVCVWFVVGSHTRTKNSAKTNVAAAQTACTRSHFNLRH